MPDPETGEIRVRPFADFLQELDDGAVHAEMSSSLRDLIEAVNTTGKTGTLTLTIKAKPAGRNAFGNLIVTHEVKVKEPDNDRPESVWFVTPDGNLSRDNPAQQRLPLREVRKPTIRTNEAEEAASD
jgi:hypothetical protein